jgi:hypothetical protein
MTIIDAWDKLNEYHKKIGRAEQAAKSPYQDTVHVPMLIQFLPVNYQGVIDTLVSQM